MIGIPALGHPPHLVPSGVGENGEKRFADPPRLAVVGQDLFVEIQNLRVRQMAVPIRWNPATMICSLMAFSPNYQ